MTSVFSLEATAQFELHHHNHILTLRVEDHKTFKIIDFMKVIKISIYRSLYLITYMCVCSAQCEGEQKTDVFHLYVDLISYSCFSAAPYMFYVSQW